MVHLPTTNCLKVDELAMQKKENLYKTVQALLYLFILMCNISIYSMCKIKEIIDI